MGFTVSSLTAYVNEQSKTLITATQFKGETAALANLQTGIKSSAALQILTNSPVPQDGTSCGFNASGDSTFTQRVIATSAIKYEDTLCPRSLQTKWTQLLLKGGQVQSESDIPSALLDDIVKQIVKRNETADWQGDTTSGSSYLNRYDGLIKIIGAASGVVSATASTFNATNARAILKNVVLNIPAALKGDSEVKIFMGYDTAEIYRQALMDANLYHVAPSNGVDVLKAEGSIYEIVPVHGLDGLYSTSGQACIYALKPSNMYLGVDMEGEEEDAKLWYSQDDDNVKYSFRFRRGWQIAIPSEIVKYANS